MQHNLGRLLQKLPSQLKTYKVTKLCGLIRNVPGVLKKGSLDLLLFKQIKNLVGIKVAFENIQLRAHPD